MIINSKTIAVSILCLALFVLRSEAQETMTNDISLVYMEKLIAVAKENYPRMKNFDQQLNKAKNNINKQSVSWFDGFSFNYIIQPRNNLDIVNPNLLNGYQFGFNFNLGTTLQKPYNVKQAKIEYNIAKTDKAEYELTLEAEVKRRYYDYVQKLNIAKLQTKSYADVQNMFTDIKGKYEKGTVIFQEYNNALITLNTQAESKINAEGALLIAKSTLEEIIGKKLEEVK